MAILVAVTLMVGTTTPTRTPLSLQSMAQPLRQLRLLFPLDEGLLRGAERPGPGNVGLLSRALL
jgi:hypothetical protein